MRTTISTIDREVDALAHLAADQVHRGRPVIKHARLPPRQPHARTTQATPATQSQPVRLIELDQTRRYDINQLVDGLHEPPGRPPAGMATPRRTRRTEIDRLLLAIPATEYVHALTGITPDRAGKIHCPFHDDARASLQLYDDGTWYCFGACKAGGSIFDFASRVFGLEPRGRAFLKLRGRLADELLPLSEGGHMKRSWTPDFPP